jgi:hypothetical protein
VQRIATASTARFRRIHLNYRRQQRGPVTEVTSSELHGWPVSSASCDRVGPPGASAVLVSHGDDSLLSHGRLAPSLTRLRKPVVHGNPNETHAPNSRVIGLRRPLSVNYSNEDLNVLSGAEWLGMTGSGNGRLCKIVETGSGHRRGALRCARTAHGG